MTKLNYISSCLSEPIFVLVEPSFHPQRVTRVGVMPHGAAQLHPLGILTLESPEILALGEGQSMQAHFRRGASGIRVESANRIRSCFISTEKI